MDLYILTNRYSRITTTTIKNIFISPEVSPRFCYSYLFSHPQLLATLDLFSIPMSCQYKHVI